uniref:Uncharacterized protein n=1 Tax=Anopheles albimanus TaxID=7167 RepID=A0A182FXK3_ANOAL
MQPRIVTLLCLAIPLFGLLLIIGGALLGLAIGLGLFPQSDGEGMVYRMLPEYANNHSSINSTFLEKLIES